VLGPYKLSLTNPTLLTEYFCIISRDLISVMPQTLSWIFP